MAPLSLTKLPTSADALHAAYEQRAATAAPGSHNDWRRDHLGASLIGHECDRYLWLTFRWAFNPKFEGRMLRLFSRGDREEAWIVQDLREAGFDVQDRDPATGEQWRVVWHGGHFGGGLDGIVTGLLEAPKTPHALEVKTFNRKQFEKLLKDGVKRTKPQHWAQMQVYMRGRKLDRAFYVAVCKDDDRIYTERVHLDAAAADEFVARAGRIIEANIPPDRQPDPAYPPCRFTTADGEVFDCPSHELCWGDGVMAEKNCRTCVSCSVHVSEEADKAWRLMMGANAPALMACEHHGKSLPPMEQRAGCASHLTIPSILNMQVAAVDEAARRITYQSAEGRTIVDGGAA